MDEKKDLETLYLAWKDLSLMGKVLFLLPPFFSILSLGSIAGQVYKLKGFMLNAVNAYQNLASFLTSIVAQLIHLEVSQKMVDTFIISVLTYKATHLIEVLNIRNLGLKFSKLKNKLLRLSLFFVIYISLYRSPSLVFLLCTGPIFVAVMASCYQDPLNFRMYTSRDEYYSLGYILSVYIVFGILTAISEGLTRI